LSPGTALSPSLLNAAAVYAQAMEMESHRDRAGELMNQAVRAEARQRINGCSEEDAVATSLRDFKAAVQQKLAVPKQDAVGSTEAAPSSMGAKGLLKTPVEAPSSAEQAPEAHSSATRGVRARRLQQLREQLAATQQAGQTAEREADQLWQECTEDQRRRASQYAARQNEFARRREERMAEIQATFRNFNVEDRSGTDYDSWRRQHEDMPRFEAGSERYRKEMPHFTRLLEKLASMRGGGRFDSAAETVRWAAFEESVAIKGAIGLDDLPLPATDSFPGMNSKEFKENAMRWHPDKFMQRYQDKLNDDEAEAILEAVVSVFQNLNNAYRR